jgi:hypothetical protein
MLMPRNLRNLLEEVAAVIRAEEEVATVVVVQEMIMAVVAMIKAEEVVAVAKAVVVLVPKGAKQVLHLHHQKRVHPQHVQTDLQTAPLFSTRIEKNQINLTAGHTARWD